MARKLGAHDDAGFEWRGAERIQQGLELIRPDQPQSFNLDDFAGGTFRDKPILDLAGVIGQIDSGTAVSLPSGEITYTFLSKDHLVGLYNNPTIGFTAGVGISPFSAAQQTAARASIQLWDDLVAARFAESNGTGADIVFANSADPAQAYAYYPTLEGWKFQSDVFVADPALNWTNNWFAFSGYGTTTLIHEIGHTLGLSHPGAYNFVEGQDLNYVNNAEYAQDSEQYTLMSYWAGSETGARSINWSVFLTAFAQTPMLHDILTIQAKYGADLTTRAGDTTYGFNSNAGNVVYDFSKNAFPYLSIYDAGGNDTLDLSGFTIGQQIDLHAGSFSSVGGAIPSAAAINQAIAELNLLTDEAFGDFSPVTQATVNAVGNSFRNANASSIAADTGVTGVLASEYLNLSIAYGTTIENAVGGSARDVIWGNQVANRLEGRAGNDVLNGFEGNDVLVGGLGLDVLTGGAGADRFDFSAVEKGDRISDFQSGLDKIDLTGLGADLTWIGSAKFSGQAGEVHFVKGVLEADLNGDRTADFAVFVDGGPVVNTDLLMI